MSFTSGLKSAICRVLRPEKNMLKEYNKRYRKHTFSEALCKNEHQYEAVITKLYHSIEKGLSYQDYRPGFGKNNITKLISALENYSVKYDTSAFFYETALSTLQEYVKKNQSFGVYDADLEAKINSLKGTANSEGGIIEFKPYNKDGETFDFEKFVRSRHSIRYFSDEAPDIQRIISAIKLAQHTPSACNRQGWKARVVCNRDLIHKILCNQNGNRGFSNEINTLLVITGDLRYFSRTRENYQAFIDGGMYAMNVLHSLHHQGLATIPLSASLRYDQESKVRAAIGIDDAEVLIMFIGVGNYPEKCVTTKSARKPSNIEVLE